MREICISTNQGAKNNSQEIAYCKTRIANKNILVEAYYRRSLYRCKKYLSEYSDPDIIIRATQDEFEKELKRLPVTVSYDCISDNITTDLSDIESSIHCFKIAREMLKFNTLLIHGSALAINNKCYIFMAPSGTGKTTHTYNWLKVIPGTIVINGDKPLVDVENRIVYGTPWCGKEGLNTNTSCKLAGIISLNRSVNNSIHTVDFKELLPTFMQQIYIPTEREAIKKSSYLIGLLRNVPCYMLKCNMNADSAIIAYEGIKKNEQRMGRID